MARVKQSSPMITSASNRSDDLFTLDTRPSETIIELGTLTRTIWPLSAFLAYERAMNSDLNSGAFVAFATVAPFIVGLTEDLARACMGLASAFFRSTFLARVAVGPGSAVME